MNQTRSRRDVLKWSALGLGASLLPESFPGSAFAESSTQNRSIRIAHLTDFHIQPELAAGEGVAACLHHVQDQKDRPELILAGGDLIMDGASHDFDRTKLQWDLWRSTTQSECSLPIECCLGNHDVWGWHKEGSKTTGEEPLWGKRWACEEFGIERTYRSFDRAGWHFVILDSIFPHEKTTYEARLDDEQFEWLKSDLAGTKPETPVLVLSHIPILAACVLAVGPNQNEERDATVSHSVMHTDFQRIKDLFWKHPNVKLCLSGHMHLRDRADYNGITYLCNGSVCGSWWKGDHHQTKAGYAVIDLYDDGSFANEYIEYGWKPRKS